MWSSFQVNIWKFSCKLSYQIIYEYAIINYSLAAMKKRYLKVIIPKPWLWWHAVAAYLTANTNWEWAPLEMEMAILAVVDIAMPVAMGTKYGFCNYFIKYLFKFLFNFQYFCFVLDVIYCSFNCTILLIRLYLR